MISQNFTKIHLGYDEQVSLLESRGLIVSDKVLPNKKRKKENGKRNHKNLLFMVFCSFFEKIKLK